ncbi:hypothetical protein BS638_08170 [Clostridium tepidum]|jgi:hypothetical protein|uniref:Uncharacterized protein n=1 Tax=Clostridium tepidum TaxID=1962263 RepID=A0A1S9I5Y0_9CLOT|nr:hypothetical protein BS637_07455 [Clostridium tepidum]OOO65744.1 hypothetical protein BS638_08170 [Clostridium tepidum]
MSTIKIIVASNKRKFIKVIPNLNIKDISEKIRIIDVIHFKIFIESSPLVINFILYINIAFPIIIKFI